MDKKKVPTLLIGSNFFLTFRIKQIEEMDTEGIQVKKKKRLKIPWGQGAITQLSVLWHACPFPFGRCFDVFFFF